jgi:hypothetical protein
VKPGTLVTGPPQVTGWVYALLHDGRSFYVGQTINPWARLERHRERWPHGIQMLILEGPLPQGPRLDDAEQAWIATLAQPGRSEAGAIAFDHGPLANVREPNGRARRDGGSGGARPGAGRPPTDEKGNVYGRLTVLESAGTRDSKALWLVECECGTRKVVAGHDLRRGDTRSCGCLLTESRLRNLAVRHVAAA